MSEVTLVFTEIPAAIIYAFADSAVQDIKQPEITPVLTASTTAVEFKKLKNDNALAASASQNIGPPRVTPMLTVPTASAKANLKKKTVIELLDELKR